MKVMVVDDEALARQRLQRLIADRPSMELIGEAASGEEAIEQAKQLQPDVVLIDIRMPGLDGIAAARQLADFDPAPAVIFCTAYDDRAIEAFEAAAIGYLLKPISRDKLDGALRQAETVNRAQLAKLQTGSGERTRLAAETANGVEVVAVDEIRYFQASHKYVTAIHPGGELLLGDSLKKLEEEFGDRFIRVHRNALVAVQHITRLTRYGVGRYRVELDGVEQGPEISRRHLAGVKAALRLR